MVSTTLRIALTMALVGIAWVAGRAQSSQPTFEIVVEAPAGQTTIQCVRGCELSWVERGVNPNAQTMQTFTFKCDAPSGRCSSFTVGGWLKP
jgi:hypothetical protein